MRRPKSKNTKGTKRQRRKPLRAAPGSASFVDFNVNDYVEVKLTDYGRQALRANYDKLGASCGGKLAFEFKLPQEDKEGWSRWQMWSLMQDLGPHIGMNPPFETTIRIQRPTVELRRTDQ